MTELPRFDDGTAVQDGAPGYPTTAQRTRPEVRWRDAQGTHAVALDEVRTLVGSGPTVALRIDDPAASRMHAEFELRDTGVWVRDLESRNGTFVQGVRVALACVPLEGTVRIGATELSVTSGAAPTRVDLWPSDEFGPMVGRSVVMREMFARLERTAALDSTVLVLGETGTGKELVAQAIHERSRRAAGPLVTVDCAALPENLLEAELFGHARGAFTGASESRAGAIEAAAGGTVFLDEVGELPLAMQPKLLRVLESRTIRRLGETAARKVDARFIAATHRDLRTMVNAGAFREDLYFRLAVLPIEVPPLRARLEDVPLLVRRLAPDAAAGLLDAPTLADLMHRPWLGNVRELRNFVERLAAFGARDALAMAPSPEGVGARGERFPDVRVSEPFKDVRERWLSHLEREYVRGLLARYDGNVSAGAEAAGLDRSYVHRLIRKHDL